MHCSGRWKPIARSSGSTAFSPSALRGVQRPPNAFGIACDHFEIRPRRLVGIAPALLPVAERAEWNAIARSKLFLRERQRAADDLRLRGPLHALQFGRSERLSIGVC